jgi:calcium permeable stress-gated cation channel
MSVIFTYICHMRFYPVFTKTPLEVAQHEHELKERPNKYGCHLQLIHAALSLKPPISSREDLDVSEDAQSHTTSR